MRKFAAIASVAALGLGLQAAAHAYNVTAAVTFTFGGSANSANADQGFWTFAGPVSVGGIQPDNGTLIHTLSGANSTHFYNPDFATGTGGTCSDADPGDGLLCGQDPNDDVTPGSGDCMIGGALVPAGATFSQVRKYGCRYESSIFGFTFARLPTLDAGPVGQASGTITVTDTTLTGTLTIVNTSDEPTGATTTFTVGTTGTPGTTRTSNSIGNGFAGYNYREADESPFGNVWYGATTAGTYTLNLTGSFNNTTWIITGGSATFTDPGFACQQGAPGGDARGTMCSSSRVGGQFNPDGSQLSWGMDPDGISTGTTAAAAIQIRSADGSSLLTTLSGVIASMGIAVNGDITTNSGEFRRAWGISGLGCPDHIRYDTVASKLSCGWLIAGNLSISGAVPDTDGDGVRDGADNCTLVANATQVDSNGDGYGNFCDADINDSGLTTATDFNLLRACINQAGVPSGTATCQASDMNGSGLVTSTDFNLLRARINTAPGPSGLH